MDPLAPRTSVDRTTHNPREEDAQLSQQTPPLERPLPKTEHPPKRKLTVAGVLPLLFGRSVVALAAAGAITGAVIGSLDAGPRDHAPRTELVASAHPGTEVADAGAVLGTLLKLIAPQGIDRQTILNALGHVALSATIDGRRYDAYLTRESLSINASPGMSFPVDWLPDPSISTLTYRFDTARFEADGTYANLIIDRANDRLLQRLPKPMRAAGYNPFFDPKLEANLQQLIDAVGASGGSGAGGLSISAPEIRFDVTLPNEVRLPLDDAGHVAVIREGTRADVSFTASGTIGAPRLESLYVHFSRPVNLGEGMGGIEIHAITLRPGGQVELEYQLTPERMVDGLRALFLLGAVAVEPRLVFTARTGELEPTHLDGFRAKVQTELDGKVEPAFRNFVRAHDGDVPGLSLLSFFGIE